ncbi:MAG TPA: GNAT family N-acetyltransferase [Micromonosporaceae bacterium]|nr:GNAT family N-acetyltransferase [Micromonosporaceae bacterium]
MTTEELPLHVPSADDWDEISRMLFRAFHDPFDESVKTAEREVFEPERSLLARDANAVVAHAGAYSRELSVPGAVVPAAHVTLVGVAPTHRRRRLLSRMMHRQLQDIRAAGREPVAVLWASEAPIYPRFGYGHAAPRVGLDVNSAAVGLAPGDPGRLRAGDPTELQPELAKVYDQLRGDRPGWSSRDDRWWRYVLGDLPTHRHGATERRAVLHEGPDGVDGYALWRTKGEWDSRGPKGEARAEAIVAATPEAYLALWRFLLSIDLTRSVTYRYAAPDEPLQHLVADPRQLGAQLSDGLWLRIVDVGSALSARRYATEIDVVLDVTDPLLPDNAGRWRLSGGPTGARCERTTDAADLVLNVRYLGTAYLGGPSLAALAAAGLVRELTPGTLAQASAAFGWHREPAAVEVF